MIVTILTVLGACALAGAAWAWRRFWPLSPWQARLRPHDYCLALALWFQECAPSGAWELMLARTDWGEVPRRARGIARARAVYDVGTTFGAAGMLGAIDGSLPVPAGFSLPHGCPPGSLAYWVLRLDQATGSTEESARVLAPPLIMDVTSDLILHWWAALIPSRLSPAWARWYAVEAVTLCEQMERIGSALEIGAVPDLPGIDGSALMDLRDKDFREIAALPPPLADAVLDGLYKAPRSIDN